MKTKTNPCPHIGWEYLADQPFPGGETLRLYNCITCHTTKGFPETFRTDLEIQHILFDIWKLRKYLLNKENPITKEKNFEVLEELVNTVSRARTLNTEA